MISIEYYGYQYKYQYKYHNHIVYFIGGRVDAMELPDWLDLSPEGLHKDWLLLSTLQKVQIPPKKENKTLKNTPKKTLKRLQETLSQVKRP